MRVDSFAVKFDHTLWQALALQEKRIARSRIAIGGSNVAVEYRLPRLKRHLMGFPPTRIRASRLRQILSIAVSLEVVSARARGPPDNSRRRPSASHSLMARPVRRQSRVVLALLRPASFGACKRSPGDHAATSNMLRRSNQSIRRISKRLPSPGGVSPS